jgi:hypothetical protein
MLEEDKRSTDPSALTTAAILREIANLKENTQQRFDAMDKAVIKLSEDSTRVPTVLDKAISQLKELIIEKFNGVAIKFEGVEKQFEEREIRIDKLQTESQRAITAAFSAQKESASSENQSLVKAINKAEQITENQLVQQRSTLAAVEKNLTDKIGDVSDRLNRSEGVGAGRDKISAPLWAAASAILTAITISAIMAIVNKQEPDTTKLDKIAEIVMSHDLQDKQVKP